MRATLLIARSVLIEAVRRKEIYAIVLLSVLLIGAVGTTRFFELEGIGKFFREIALKVMSVATSLTVIVLAARQLPREFETRTIYPLLAKPISRGEFLLGKLLGVMGAGLFCFGIFMIIFVLGSWSLGTPIHWPIFLQYLYVQTLGMLVLATLAFLLSLLTNLDAAITIATLFFMLGSILLNAITFLHSGADKATIIILKILLYGLPQMTLFDLSGKVVHQEAWGAIDSATILSLTLYAFTFAAIYFAISLALFRRRPL